MFVIVVLPFQVQGALKEDWFDNLTDAPVCLKGKINARFMGVRDATPLSRESGKFEKSFKTGIVTKFNDPNGGEAYYFSVRNAIKKSDEVTRSMLYEWMMVMFEWVTGKTTSGRGRGNNIESSRMELRVNRSCNPPLLTLSGNLLVPFNDNSFALPFLGKAILSKNNNKDNQGKTEVFKATKENRKQQRADDNVITRVFSVEIEDVGSQYCEDMIRSSEDGLNVFAIDRLVGEKKGKLFSCGEDFCFCGVTACLKSGRCLKMPSEINANLLDPYAIDYRECRDRNWRNRGYNLDY
ncbi:MAG: hypothetical protein ACPG5T_00270 [Endozoicomonas sp.]